MQGLLQGKRVLITGAGRGIGLAIARLFAAQGAELWLAGRDEAALSRLADELGAEFGVSCHSLCVDVAQPQAVKQAFQQLFAQTRQLDVLVNNAGMLEEGLLGMVNQAQLEQTFSHNTFSVVYCSQYAARLMQRSGGGSIINLASLMGRVGAAGLCSYAGSKAAVIGITQSLAKELAASRIRVNAIAPGFIDTEMAHAIPDDKFAERLASIAMGRIGTPDEVAKVALFLASDLASYVTGQVIGVDGGHDDLMDHAHALLAHLREDNPAPVWRDPQEGWLSYGELAQRVARLAAGYPDERSLVYLPFFTRTAHLLHYLAALKLGHVVMLADPALPASQHDASCRQFGVSWRVNASGQLERLAATTPTLHPALSVLLPTSGSTGSAKWVRLSGRNLAANATAIADYLALTAAERAITSLPLYYSYGLSVLNSHLLVGASLVQHEGSVLERDFWQQVDLHEVSSFAGVPFTYQMLARLRFDWARYPSLQTLTQAGGRLEPALAQQFAEQALRLDRRFFVMYGQTEATARMAWLAAPEVAAHPDAIGRAIPGGQFTLRALEGGNPGEGELVYRGDNVMLGYAGTAEDLALGAQLQELATGDLARCDEAGRYYICGRLSRFLKLFGKRVSLAEVESQLHRWGWAGACGGRDDCLLVAVEPRGDQMADGLQRELAQWLQAPPRAVQVVQMTQLPRTANHKIDYAALARLAGEA